MLAIQIAKDSWQGRLTLAKLVDFGHLVHGHPALDWDVVHEESRRLHISKIVSFSREIVRAVTGVTAAGGNGKTTDTSAVARPVQQVVGRLCQRRLREEDPRRDQLRLHSLLRERFRDRVFPYYQSLRYDLRPVRLGIKRVAGLLLRGPGRSLSVPKD